MNSKYIRYKNIVDMLCFETIFGYLKATEAFIDGPEIENYITQIIKVNNLFLSKHSLFN